MMKNLKEIIKEGIEKNEKDLKKGLLELNSVNKLLENEEINFNIEMEFNFYNKLLDVKYSFKKYEKEMVVYFKVDCEAYIRECYILSIELVKYASLYFNGKAYRKNIGDFEGDYYVDIETFIKCLFEVDEELNFEFDYDL